MAVLRAAASFLGARGVEEPRLDAELLLAEVLGCDRLRLYTRHDMPLFEDARERMRELVRRRARGEPVAYILGRREFYGIEFRVDPRCLIPRPETELVLDEAFRFLDSRPGPKRILDLCTGSGCIAIAIACLRGGHDLWAVDFSGAALSVARDNHARLAPGESIRFLEGDLYAPLPGEPFDLIASNPPYITTAEMAELPPSIRSFEPALALECGDDPLAFHRRILDRGADRLRPGGCFILEMGASGAAPGNSLGDLPGLSLETRRDLQGIDRVLIARRKG